MDVGKKEIISRSNLRHLKKKWKKEFTVTISWPRPSGFILVGYIT